MKSPKELLQGKIAINAEIMELWQENGAEEKRKPMFDGIVDEESYVNAPFKILWILKEPWDNFDEDDNGNEIAIGGGKDYAELVKTEPQEFGMKIKSWKMIAYVSYSILSALEKWNEVPDIDEDMCNVLRQISFINVQKLPAGTTTSEADIKAAYDDARNRRILHKQIELLAPNIIIGGNTLKYFEKYLFDNSDGVQMREVDLNNFVEGERVRHYCSPKRICIDAYHPSRCGGWSYEEYVNCIVSAVRYWNENIKA